MKEWQLLIPVVILLIVLFLISGTEEAFTIADVDYATLSLKKLIEGNCEIQDVSDEELMKLKDKILMARLPKKPVEDSTKENFTSYHNTNVRYWPSYFYSFPYNYKNGGAWPSNLFTRLRYWSPTFYSGNGWMHALRPGISYNPAGWQRNVWLKNRGGYYMINNGYAKSHNALRYWS